jgi:hypothetical protein
MVTEAEVLTRHCSAAIGDVSGGRYDAASRWHVTVVRAGALGAQGDVGMKQCNIVSSWKRYVYSGCQSVGGSRIRGCIGIGRHCGGAEFLWP